MNKTLVAYFSASGITAGVARNLAEGIHGDLYEIKPAVPYTEADLDWKDNNSRSSIEMSNPQSRPELADKDAKILNYDIIFIGFPIWWYVAPTIINTFLESYNFAGKKIILFATSGSSGFGETRENLVKSCPGAELISGGILNRKMSKEELVDWAKKYT